MELITAKINYSFLSKAGPHISIAILRVHRLQKTQNSDSSQKRNVHG
jgi:hypothetical protein